MISEQISGIKVEPKKFEIVFFICKKFTPGHVPGVNIIYSNFEKDKCLER